MSRIVLSEFLSLDGVMETPESWVFPYMNKDIQKFKLDEALAAGSLLLGYHTYQIFAASWPSRSDPDGFADKMNGMPKYVLSSTSEKLAWNNSHVLNGGSAEGAVASLKQQPGQDLLVTGSGFLVQLLMRFNLIDEYRILIFPITLGKGKRLFNEGQPAELKLTEAKAFDTGVILLRYEKC